MRRHPFNVRPLGNALSDGLEDPSVRRKNSLGRFGALPDALIVRILEHLSTSSDAFSSLTALTYTSTYLRAFAVDEDIWRRLIFKSFSVSAVAEVSDSPSWRVAFHRLHGKGQIENSSVVPTPVYSDVLFHKWRCVSSDIPKEWLSRDNILRISASSTSVEEFRAHYEKPGIPVVITDLVSSWPAFSNWDEKELVRRFGDVKFHAGGFEFPLKDYMTYCSNVRHRDDQPLYIFDYNFAEKVPDLAQEYTVPGYFEDLFNVLGDQRPDYRWLIIGPARSGSSFHIDPNGTAAWNAVIRGAKKWVMFPPDCPPPGVIPSDDEGDVTAPVSVTEWFLNFYDPDVLERCGAIECVVREGEMMFVPMGWWHCVLNVETSIAITQNFVSSVNVEEVAKWLRERPRQVSGCRSENQAKFIRENFARLACEANPQLKARLRSFIGRPNGQTSEIDEKNASAKRQKMGLWESLQSSGSNNSNTRGAIIDESCTSSAAQIKSFSFCF